MNVRPGHEWDRFEGLSIAAGDAAGASSTACRSREGAAAVIAPRASPVPAALAGRRSSRRCRRRQGFGALLNELGREQTALADRIVTTSPDVTVSTNLGAWVNRRGLFARETLADTFKSERIPSTFNLGVLAARASTSSSASPR